MQELSQQVRGSVAALFRADPRGVGGSIALLSAALLSVLILSVGVTIDLCRWLHAKSDAHLALASAAYTGARMLQIAPDAPDRAVRAARQAFAQNRSSAVHYEVAALEFEVAADRATVAARASAWMPTTVLKIVGIDRLVVLDTSPEPGAGVAGASRATSGSKRGTSLEVAIAVDLSSGLHEQMLEPMKTGLREMADTLVWQNQDGATSRIALVPFADGVAPDAYKSVVGPIRPGVCRSPGCSRFNFRRRDAADCVSEDCSRTYVQTPCVVERSGQHAFSDAAPASGRPEPAYQPPGAACRSGNAVKPLTSDRDDVVVHISGLERGGRSAPQVGIAWAWYVLSPEWSGIWPGGSAPASYADLTSRNANGSPRLRKTVVVIQSADETVQHCQGVDDRAIACAAPNGPFAVQVRALCTAMRRTGISIFVIGLNLRSGGQGIEPVLRDHCAGAETAYYDVHTGDELRQALRDIALDLSPLLQVN